jgi:hypothetical protein
MGCTEVCLQHEKHRMTVHIMYKQASSQGDEGGPDFRNANVILLFLHDIIFVSACFRLLIGVTISVCFCSMIKQGERRAQVLLIAKPPGKFGFRNVEEHASDT